jgi:ABC-type glutathione transport system ATPase component
MGYADRIAMLKAGGVKEEAQIDELSKSTLGSYLTKKTSEYMKGKTQPGSKEHAKDVQNMGKAYDKLKKEEAELDEAYQTAKSEFVARQGRLTAAAAETEKDPARLKRMSSIPGYSAAMDLAKKTTLGAKHTKEDVEELDELSKTTLGSYAKKASRDAVITRKIGVDFENKPSNESSQR